jgi:probable F420-dependent oxidoreductase
MGHHDASVETTEETRLVTALQLGIVTPIVNLNPRFDPPEWERSGGIEDLVVVAQAADRLGYTFLGCPEHVAIPSKVAATRGGRYYDPVATLGYLAAHTTSIGLLSHVTVLGYHHPLAIVKRYGTLDAISGGRVVLGVGVGSLRAEFRLLGADFEGRGERADDALVAIRSAFGQEVASHQGPHYSYEDWIVDPHGRSTVPIWVGGLTRRSLRRALELGDGWIPFGLTLEALEPILAAPALAAQRQARGGTFAVVLAPEPPLDPLGAPDASAEVATAYARIGATHLALRFIHHSRDHYVEQLEAMRSVIDNL